MAGSTIEESRVRTHKFHKPGGMQLWGEGAWLQSQRGARVPIILLACAMPMGALREPQDWALGARIAAGTRRDAGGQRLQCSSPL